MKPFTLSPWRPLSPQAAVKLREKRGNPAKGNYYAPTTWQPKTCQWIDDNPTKNEIRRYGSEWFKCGEPVKFDRPYCHEHCARAYKVVDRGESPTEIGTEALIKVPHGKANPEQTADKKIRTAA